MNLKIESAEGLMMKYSKKEKKKSYNKVTRHLLGEIFSKHSALIKTSVRKTLSRPSLICEEMFSGPDRSQQTPPTPPSTP